MKVTGLSSVSIKELVHTNAVPAYQPIVGGKSNTAHYEALGRLVIDGELLLPEQFFPLLKEAGSMADFDMALAPLVIEQMGVWKGTLGTVTVHVNASREALRSLSYLHVLRYALKEHSVPAHWLTVEILENTSFWNDEEMLEVLRGLRQLGIHIAIDDVPCWDDVEGLLAWLRKGSMGVELLKLDHALVRKACDEGIVGGPATTELFTYVEFAHEHGMGIVAEGVESEEDIVFMEVLGVDQFQGNAIGEPQLAQRAYHTIENFQMDMDKGPRGAIDRLGSARSRFLV